MHADGCEVVLAGHTHGGQLAGPGLSLIHISEPTRPGMISYAGFCLKKKKEIKYFAQVLYYIQFRSNYYTMCLVRTV